MMFAGVVPLPWFLIVALNVTGSPFTGDDGDHEIAVTIKSGTPAATAIEFVRLLLASLLSAIRFTSSTNARTECVPSVAVQVLEPVGPLFAVSVRLAPAASELELVSDQFTCTSSTRKPTP